MNELRHKNFVLYGAEVNISIELGAEVTPLPNMFANIDCQESINQTGTAKFGPNLIMIEMN